MNLRSKTLIVVGTFLICLIIILYIAAQIELRTGFSDLEKNETQKNVYRGLNAISNELTTLADIANFWAARNDTYAFMITNDTAFIRNNLVSGSLANESLHNIGINLILFMDSYGQIVFGRYLNFIGNPEEIPKNLTEQLALYGFCPGCLDKKSKFAGVILISGQPMLIVTQPITNTMRTSPSEGRVILGRYLTKKEVSKLADITQLNITIFNLGEKKIPDDLRQVRTTLKHDPDAISIKPLNETIITGYMPLHDIYGNPVLILRVASPRESYLQGTKSLHSLIILFSVAGFLFLILTLFYLDKSVLSRLIRLTTAITMIGRTQNIANRVVVQGKDELAQLAISVNSMLTALDNSNSELRESEKRYKAIVEEQTDLICRYLYDGTITFANDVLCTFLSKKEDELIGAQVNQLKFDVHLRSAEELKTVLNADSPSITYEGQAIKGADRHWILWTSHGIFDESGAMAEVQSTGRDITELKIAEEAISQLQRRQADIIDFLPEALLAIDLDGKVIVWNKAMEDLTGTQARDILGKGHYEYSLPFYGFRRPILADMVLKPFEHFEQEYNNFQKDGLTVLGETFIPTLGRNGSYLLAKATALYDNSGNVIGSIESVRDMTKFRQMENRLERSRTELHIASEIQKSFIPKKTPIIPNFELSAMTMPAMEVGGDFYDFISLKDGKYGLVIADVAGKSISGALFMALSRMIIRTSAAHQLDTTEVLKNANNMIALDATTGMFVTLLYGVLDGEAYSLKYANAGHPSPLLFGKGISRYTVKNISGIALGAKEGASYEEQTIKFSPGDFAVFYTDGITEAMNPDGEMYGLKRLNDIIIKSSMYTADIMIGLILKDISSFCDNREQTDDITLVVLKAHKQKSLHSEIIIEAKERNILEVMEQIEKVMLTANFCMEATLKMQLATEETCINIIRHGYRGADGKIFIIIDFEEDCLSVTIEDNAPPFDPIHFDKLAFIDNVDEQPIGGLGIYLIKSMIDELRYEYHNERNRLTLIKWAKSESNHLTYD